MIYQSEPTFCKNMGVGGCLDIVNPTIDSGCIIPPPAAPPGVAVEILKPWEKRDITGAIIKDSPWDVRDENGAIIDIFSTQDKESGMSYTEMLDLQRKGLYTIGLAGGSGWTNPTAEQQAWSAGFITRSDAWVASQGRTPPTPVPVVVPPAPIVPAFPEEISNPVTPSPIAPAFDIGTWTQKLMGYGQPIIIFVVAAVAVWLLLPILAQKRGAKA